MSDFLNGVYTFWNQIIYALSTIRIFDIIDIIFIAYLIYKAIGFLKESRAGQLVKGIIVFLALYFVANIFELAVLRWLLSAIFDSAIIAIAIIFQPELRRILERMGQVKLSHSQSGNSQVINSIDKICRAAGNMSENKIGALIVFERTTQLGEIINTGTVLDSNVSTDLVNNIFFPKSPLHDGAMIIRDGRIQAAGCILPLTPSTAFSSTLGTRHRAAIGMTENSDAIVLVVSEETGIISIAYNGQITRNFNVASAFAEIKSKIVDEHINEKDSTVVTTLKRFIPLLKDKNLQSEKKEEE